MLFRGGCSKLFAETSALFEWRDHASTRYVLHRHNTCCEMLQLADHGRTAKPCWADSAPPLLPLSLSPINGPTNRHDGHPRERGTPRGTGPNPSCKAPSAFQGGIAASLQVEPLGLPVRSPPPQRPPPRAGHGRPAAAGRRPRPPPRHGHPLDEARPHPQKGRTTQSATERREG